MLIVKATIERVEAHDGRAAGPGDLVLDIGIATLRQGPSRIFSELPRREGAAAFWRGQTSLTSLGHSASAKHQGTVRRLSSGFKSRFRIKRCK